MSILLASILLILLARTVESCERDITSYVCTSSGKYGNASGETIHVTYSDILNVSCCVAEFLAADLHFFNATDEISGNGVEKTHFVGGCINGTVTISEFQGRYQHLIVNCSALMPPEKLACGKQNYMIVITDEPTTTRALATAATVFPTTGHPYAVNHTPIATTHKDSSGAIHSHLYAMVLPSVVVAVLLAAIIMVVLVVVVIHRHGLKKRMACSNQLSNDEAEDCENNEDSGTEEDTVLQIKACGSDSKKSKKRNSLLPPYGRSVSNRSNHSRLSNDEAEDCDNNEDSSEEHTALQIKDCRRDSKQKSKKRNSLLPPYGRSVSNRSNHSPLSNKDEDCENDRY